MVPGTAGITGMAGSSVMLPSVNFKGHQHLPSGEPASSTWTGCNIGTVDANKYVVVCILPSPNGALGVNSVKVDGVTATQVMPHSEDTYAATGMYIVAMPTQSGSVDIITDYSSSLWNGGMAWYTVHNLNSMTPVGTDASTVQSPTFSLAQSAGGIVICNMHGYSSSGITYTADTMTKDFEGETGSGSSGYTGSLAGLAGGTFDEQVSRSASMTYYTGVIATFR